MKTGFRYGLYALIFLVALGGTAYLTVWLIVRGQPEVRVPDVRGRDPIAALKTLADLGLTLKVRAFDTSPHVPKDHIISQDPPPGFTVKTKRPVQVVISEGGANASMPDLRGLSLLQARSVIEQARLKPGHISRTYGFGPEQGPDRVLDQVPEPLEQVPVGTEVALLVSLGPRPAYLVMPDLVGRPYSLALTELEAAGLRVARIKAASDPDRPPDIVMAQSPSPGVRAAGNELVTLAVNGGSPVSPAGYYFKLIEYTIPFSLLRREIKIRASLDQYLIELHKGWHGPGQTVRVAALARGPSRIQVFEDGQEKVLPDAEEKYIRSIYEKNSPFHTFR
ncbi:MAG: PASTA domain-containing protein [Proteobacteria bacterium]|nr:PASTA domain-containing protein [Pseudomonadota bacterium]